ncbi:hypothetical protein RHSIM_Rhsim10G0207000 [Rhododendron simsii]|uniref:RNase H type-1 domain-containing protein n=1 Tax=Rhododendron simsii TaxID=118357 RepID=A0A834LEL2_RHOSS|nr:hypothetical protein RHSIM_Rhsim10G0207000 [Rhododendron simsii]
MSDMDPSKPWAWLWHISNPGVLPKIFRQTTEHGQCGCCSMVAVSAACSAAYAIKTARPPLELTVQDSCTANSRGGLAVLIAYAAEQAADVATMEQQPHCGCGWRWALTGNLARWTASLAHAANKCWALRDGLQLLIRKHIINVGVETDAQAAISLMLIKQLQKRKPSTELPPVKHMIFELLDSILSDCRSLLHCLNLPPVKHIFMEAIKCAILIAHDLRFSDDSYLCYEFPLDCILTQLLEDAREDTLFHILCSYHDDSDML